MAAAALWAAYGGYIYGTETACWRHPKPSVQECASLFQQMQAISVASAFLALLPVFYGHWRVSREIRIGRAGRARVGDYIIVAYLLGMGALPVLGVS